MTAPESRDAQSGVEEVLAEALSWTSGEMTRYSETAHPDHNRWSWRGDGHGDAIRDQFREQARHLAAALAPLIAGERAKALREAADDATMLPPYYRAPSRWATWLADRADREQAASATETGLSRPRRSQGYPNANDVILSRQSGGNEEGK